MARVEIANVQAALSDYHSTFGRYPADLNRDITRELLGDNPQKLVFLNARPKQTNTLGELVDPWGTPYRITTTNGVMVYSCGKDQLDDRGEPGTDDLVSWR